VADVIARPLFISFERFGLLGEVPEDCKKANVTPILRVKDPGKRRPVSPILIPEKVIDEPTPESISIFMEGQEGDQE